MAIVSGTATNNNDFLDKLKAGLIANNWALLVDQVVTTRELYFKNSNTNVIIGFKVSNIVGYNSPFSNIMPINILINSPTSYSSSFDWFNQVGSVPYYNKNTTSVSSTTLPPCFFSHDKNIYYNIFINDNRVVIVNNIAMKNVGCYVGKFKQYLSPGQHPNAVYVGGTNQIEDQFYSSPESDTDVGMFPFYNSRRENGGNYYRDRLGSWKVATPELPANNNASTQTPLFKYSNGSNLSSAYSRLMDNEDGTITLVKINIINKDGNVGELDDVYITITNKANNLDKTNDGYTIFNNFTHITRDSFFCVK